MEHQLWVTIAVGVLTGVSAATIVEGIAFLHRRRQKQKVIDHLGALIVLGERRLGLDNVAQTGQEAIQRIVWIDIWKTFLDQLQLVFIAASRHLSDEEIKMFAEELAECYRLFPDRDSPPTKHHYAHSLQRFKEALPYSVGLFDKDYSK